MSFVIYAFFLSWFVPNAFFSKNYSLDNLNQIATILNNLTEKNINFLFDNNSFDFNFVDTMREIIIPPNTDIAFMFSIYL